MATKFERALIAEEYRDSDGYWIYLVRGWQNGNDPGTHGIVESTKRDAYAVLKQARPCACDDCTAQRLAHGDPAVVGAAKAKAKETR